MSFLEYVLDIKNQENIWSNEVQQAVINNFITFLKLLFKFSRNNAILIYDRFMNRVREAEINKNQLFQSFFDIIYDP